MDEVSELLGATEPDVAVKEGAVEAKDTPVEGEPTTEELEAKAVEESTAMEAIAVKKEAGEELTPEELKFDEEHPVKEEELPPAMKAMQEQMETMNASLAALATHAADGRKAEEPVKLPALEYADIEAITSDEAFDEVIKDRKSFNNMLNLVGEYAASKAVEHLFKVIPGLVGTEALKAADTTYLIRTFWRDNKDLAALPEAKTKVSQTYNKLEALNPGKAPDALFELLGPAVRKEFGVKAPVTTQVPGHKSKPIKKGAFAPAGGASARQVDTGKTTIADEISEMEKV